MGPIQIKKKKEKKNKKKEKQTGKGNVFLFIFLFFFSHFSLRYTEIGPSEFVGVRTKRLYSTKATHGNKKHEISPSF